jgi:hypothetical protein
MHARSCISRPGRAHAVGLSLAMAVALSGPVQAARVHARVSGFGYADVSAFDLHIEASDLEVEYDDSDADGTLRLRRIGIGFFEALNENSRMGVRLGRVGFDQSGRAATEGRDPAGYFAELEFSGMWPARGRLRAALEAGWRYTSVDETDDLGTVELDWQTLELRPAVWLAVSPRLVVRAGASAVAVDGSERRSEATRETVDFETADTEGAFVTLEYHRTDGDVVSARLRTGNPSGLYVAFEHRY